MLLYMLSDDVLFTDENILHTRNVTFEVTGSEFTSS